MYYRHAWLVLLSGFFEPVFYLLGLGYGLGKVVGPIDGIAYAAFVAPALMATSAMNGAHLRLDLQPVLQAQVRQDLRRDARDPAEGGRRGHRRGHLGAHPRSHLLHRVHGRDAAAGSRVVARRPAGGAGLGAHRLRRCRPGDGRDDVRAQLAGLRHGVRHHPAAVPVQRAPSSPSRPTPSRSARSWRSRPSTAASTCCVA